MKNINKINKINKLDRLIEQKNKLKRIIEKKDTAYSGRLFLSGVALSLIVLMLLAIVLMHIPIFVLLPTPIKVTLFMIIGYFSIVESCTYLGKLSNKIFNIDKLKNKNNRLNREISALKIEKIKTIKNFTRVDFIDIENQVRSLDLLDDIIFEYENNKNNEDPYMLINEVCNSLFNENIKNNKKFDEETIVEIRRKYYQLSKEQRTKNQKNAINRIIENDFEIENC